MIQRLNQFMQRYMPVLTPVSLVIGVLLEQMGSHLLFLVPILFALMTFISSLSLKFRDIQVFKIYPKTILFIIAFLHILMPLLLHVVVGETIHLETVSLIFDLIWMIVLPSIVGMIVGEWTKGELQKRFSQPFALISKCCLFAIIMINSSAIAPYVKTINAELALVIGVVLLVAVSGYVLALLFGKLFLKSKADQVTFIFNGGMRNIAVGVVIATTYFPSKVAMPVVFGMLFQQVLASIFYKITRT